MRFFGFIRSLSIQSLAGAEASPLAHSTASRQDVCAHQPSSLSSGIVCNAALIEGAVFFLFHSSL